MTVTTLDGTTILPANPPVQSDLLSSLSLPLALVGKAKHHPSSREDAFLSHLSPEEGKAAKKEPDPTRFALPTSRQAKRRWRFRPLTAREMLVSRAATTPRRWVVDKLIPENSLAELTAFMKY